MEEDDCIEEITLDDFDYGTRIEIMADGSLRLRFAMMPPSWATREDGFDAIVELLQSATGLVVEGLDKELFVVPQPHADTERQVRALLDGILAKHRRRQGTG